MAPRGERRGLDSARVWGWKGITQEGPSPKLGRSATPESCLQSLACSLSGSDPVEGWDGEQKSMKGQFTRGMSVPAWNCGKKGKARITIYEVESGHNKST
jgi:hypothetical protein